jgi:hypothetical protein
MVALLAAFSERKVSGYGIKHARGQTHSLAHTEHILSQCAPPPALQFSLLLERLVLIDFLCYFSV